MVTPPLGAGSVEDHLLVAIGCTALFLLGVLLTGIGLGVYSLRVYARDKRNEAIVRRRWRDAEGRTANRTTTGGPQTAHEPEGV